MTNLEALEKRQNGILESMQYVENDSKEYAEYADELIKVNNAIKIEKDYEIQKRKLDIEESKVVNDKLKMASDDKVAKQDSRNKKLEIITDVVKTIGAAALNVWIVKQITDTEEFGSVTSKALGFVNKYKFW